MPNYRILRQHLSFSALQHKTELKETGSDGAIEEVLPEQPIPPTACFPPTPPPAGTIIDARIWSIQSEYL